MTDCKTCEAKDQVIASQQKVIDGLLKALEALNKPQTPYVPIQPNPNPGPPGTTWPWNKPTIRWDEGIVDQTRNCPCRVENGGSGICGCILGSGTRITC